MIGRKKRKAYQFEYKFVSMFVSNILSLLRLGQWFYTKKGRGSRQSL